MNRQILCDLTTCYFCFEQCLIRGAIFCVFTCKTYLKFGFKFRKTRPNRQVTEKKKTYICTKKQRNNNIFFTLYTRLFLFK